MTENTHKPLACHVCGELRAFIKYGEKEGKDGRIAKWPIYEPCSKKNHPEPKRIASDYSHIQLENAEIITEPIRIVEGRSGPKGLLVQLVRMNIESLNLAIARYIDRMEEPPMSAHLSRIDYETLMHSDPTQGTLEIPLVVDDSITPNYRYIFLVQSEGK